MWRNICSDISGVWTKRRLILNITQTDIKIHPHFLWIYLGKTYQDKNFTFSTIYLDQSPGVKRVSVQSLDGPFYNKITWAKTGLMEGCNKRKFVLVQDDSQAMFTQQWTRIVFTLTRITWILPRIEFTQIEIVYILTTFILSKLRPS